ncbi:Pls/PosA family non-ribosomal peptide synthetase [Legionella sp. D16C41]|uniref:Pls/PosA family non-ribosomal peptide synthetase n=1 Tax=Legionella sp. D16C41 TaxID=3402688 RepID=UPI003AF7F971
MNLPSKQSTLRQIFENTVDNYPHNTALICDNKFLSYQELENQVNKLANFLIAKGTKPNHTIGILLERSANSYITILAILKTGAAYVPIDVEYPSERINYILGDMPFYLVITSSAQLARADIQFPNYIALDQECENIAIQANTRPEEQADIDEQASCYFIYTSGSTGKPKGVEITHSSICHYVKVASQIYKMSSEDRVYQGFSLAFDASLEELWMAFANGAALVACTNKDIRSGVGLIDFLNTYEVTVFSTVPTLLSVLEGDLPKLRLLILGGEACTTNLIKRWSRPGLTIMNTYGPTEATVIATYAECDPANPITIGKPLPGYEVLILDENLQPLPQGQQGELCIAGLGLAKGYVNKPEITAQKFVQNPNKKEQRLYRTGDLAMIGVDGNIYFLGRIDDQVKLRGFRIELNEIETVIMEYEAISQAVVALHDFDEPKLVAYLLFKKNAQVNLKSFKEFLLKRLPNYMIPALLEVVESLPLLPSGKVDRKKLPKPNHTAVSEEINYEAPTTELEVNIAQVWAKEFGKDNISINADFFYDLGGHSLLAAKVISNLRKLNGLKNISILDLYKFSTIKQLAENFKHIKTEAKQPHRSYQAQKNKVSNFNYYLCVMGQFFGCLLQYAIGSWQLLAVLLSYTWLANHGLSLSLEALAIFILLFLAMPLLSLSITIGAKWLLLGRVKPGVYKLWGWFYFRWWLVERLQKNIFSPKHLIGSPLITVYYRLLGAKIGKNCYIGSVNIGTHDLLTIGDYSSIGFDARLLGYIVEDGWLKIGSITIGEKCFVGARSVIGPDTRLFENAKLDDMSMLPAHTNIPAGQFFSGSPAISAVPSKDHIINEAIIDKSSSWKSFSFGLLHYLGLVFTMIIYYLSYFPALTFITYFHENSHYLLTVSLAAPIGAVTFLGLYYLGIAISKRLLMNRIKPGVYPIKSFYYLRQWIISKMMDLDEIYVMADTLYFPYFMRFLGARLGKNVEMGETPHIIPELVTIQDEGFIASAAALAWPNVYLGNIKFAPVQVGKRGFIGNMGLLPSGGQVGEGGLLGCMSITPPDNKAADSHTAWLGSPAVFLPKREIFRGYSNKEKFRPSWRLYYTRLAIEFIRIIMPTTFTLIGLFNMLYILNILSSYFSLSTIFMLLPEVELIVICALVATIVCLKWILLGRVQAAAKPIWNIFIWKNDIIEYTYSYFICPNFTNVVLGTPFVSALLRSFGAKIGKKIFLNTADFTEFDLISIGDEACINSETIIQTHLYEDRVFKMSTVNIQQGCNVGVASIVLYNTVMEEGSTLGSFSLLMKGEHLPTYTSWQGIPAQSAVMQDDQQKIDIIGIEEGLIQA